MKTLLATAIASTFLMAAQPGAAETYNDMFVSYVSAPVAHQVSQYAAQRDLGGFILWTIDGDMPIGSKDANSQPLSLLENLNAGYPAKSGQVPTVMAFWANWVVYPQGPGSIQYGIPNAIQTDSNDIVENQDMQAKLEHINVLAYAFMETQPATFPLDSETTPGQANPNVGSLYFFDPWSDLTEDEDFCEDGANPICNYVPKVQGNDWHNFVAKMGNFKQFTQLTHTPDNPHGPLNKVISVGGYGHDASFEEIFADQTGKAQENFINSVVTVLNHYNLQGIDLDYENPNMTHQQSEQYLALIEALSAKLPEGTFITLDILADPNYQKGLRKASDDTNEVRDRGFSPGVLAKIAALNNVKAINLMTYDFHGAFDISQAEAERRTGYLSNLYPLTNGPEGYTGFFSMDASVETLIEQKVPTNKIIVGIPAYGRALTNVAETGNGAIHGLYQKLTPDTGVPWGQVDEKDCSQDILAPDHQCNGMYNYNYIVNNMLPNGFTSYDSVADTAGVVNATWAYAKSWSPGDFDHSLTLVNDAANSHFAFNVKITDDHGTAFSAPDYFMPGKTVEYAGSQLLSIENKMGLKVLITPYTQESIECDGSFDLTHPSKVNIIADTPSHCTITTY